MSKYINSQKKTRQSPVSMNSLDLSAQSTLSKSQKKTRQSPASMNSSDLSAQSTLSKSINSPSFPIRINSSSIKSSSSSRIKSSSKSLHSNHTQYHMIGNVNDYIIEILLNEPSRRLKLLQEDVKKSRKSPPRVYLEEDMKPFEAIDIVNYNAMLESYNNVSQIKSNLTRIDEGSHESLTYGSSRLKKRRNVRGGNQSHPKYDRIDLEHIQNLYKYDNHHDFNNTIIPKHLLLPRDPTVPSDEKLLLTYTLDSLSEKDDSFFMKYYYIKESDAYKIFNGDKNNVNFNDITILNFETFLNTTLNFKNSKIIYDGNVTSLGEDQKAYRQIINSTYRKESTIEVIWDPMRTSIDEYEKLVESFSNEPGKYDTLVSLTDKVFNLDNSNSYTNDIPINNDSLSAFNKYTRDVLNIQYFKRKPGENIEYSMGLIFKDYSRYHYLDGYVVKPYMRFLTYDNQRYKEIDYTSNSINTKYLIDNKIFIAIDIYVQHLTGKSDASEINSVKNITDMILKIQTKNPERKTDGDFKTLLRMYIYQHEYEKENAIKILFDLKKSGDYGKVMLCFYKNIMSSAAEKYLLVTNDRLCAVNGILRKNVNVVFGTSEAKLDGTGNEKYLCFFSCCNDTYDMQYIKQILEITFKFKGLDYNLNQSQAINIEEIIEKLTRLKIDDLNKNLEQDPRKDEIIQMYRKEVNKQKTSLIKDLKTVDFTNKSQEKYHKDRFGLFVQFISNTNTIFETLVVKRDEIKKNISGFLDILSTYPKTLENFRNSDSNTSGRNKTIQANSMTEISNNAYEKGQSERAAEIITNNYLRSTKQIREVFNDLDKLLSIFQIYDNKLVRGTYEKDTKQFIHSLYKDYFDSIQGNYNQNLVISIKDFIRYLDTSKITNSESKKVQFLNVVKDIVREQSEDILNRLNILYENIQKVKDLNDTDFRTIEQYTLERPRVNYGLSLGLKFNFVQKICSWFPLKFPNFRNLGSLFKRPSIKQTNRMSMDSSNPRTINSTSTRSAIKKPRPKSLKTRTSATSKARTKKATLTSKTSKPSKNNNEDIKRKEKEILKAKLKAKLKEQRNAKEQMKKRQREEQIQTQKLEREERIKRLKANSK